MAATIRIQRELAEVKKKPTGPIIVASHSNKLLPEGPAL